MKEFVYKLWELEVGRKGERDRNPAYLNGDVIINPPLDGPLSASFCERCTLRK